MTNFPPPPNDFLCPITKQIMIDPVVTRHGKSFERKAIYKWIEQEGNNYCPATGMLLNIDHLKPNKSLQWKIRYWMMKHKYEENDDQNNDAVTDQEDHNNYVVAPPLEKFICPLTRKIMKHPVMTRDGHNFERKAILKWIIMKGEVCPITGKELRPSDLIPNTKLEWDIEKWDDEVHMMHTFQQRQLSESKSSTVEPTSSSQGQYTCLALNNMTSSKEEMQECEKIDVQKSPASRKLLFFKKLIKSMKANYDEENDDIATISLCSSFKTAGRIELVGQ